MKTTQAHRGRNIWFQVAIVSILFIIDGAIATRRPTETVNVVPRKTRIVKPLKKNVAAIKTIQTQDGDIIDCVDIYKQPAFDHPALANHTIQMRPSDNTEELAVASYPSSPSSSVSTPARLKQLNIGDCPEGTIPILRTRKNDTLMENVAAFSSITQDAMYVYKGHFYGASGYMNIWDLKDVPPEDRSSGYILLAIKSITDDYNYISAGWKVYKALYGDQKTRFTIDWSANDDKRNAGCYNLDCPGFVHTSSINYLGSVLYPTSTFGGVQAEVKISIYMDRQSNNWWLSASDEPLGYWPASLFRYFNKAELINWGGDINHAWTTNQGCPMGNGHYPSQGFFGISAYISGALFRGENGKDQEPDSGRFIFTNKQCYDALGIGMGKFGRPGYSFYYGGDTQRVGCSL